MYTIKGETDHQPRLDAWDKRSDLVHWEDLEGAGGEGGGRGDWDGEHMQTHGCFISMYDKIHYKKKENLLNEWTSLRGLVFHTTTLAEDGTIVDWLGLHFHVLN